ncbi:MAG: cob(I)yrinic acid a,c-diamide adenosyltransferase [Ruminococcus sp.]|nr:cob(I)yrinic acid a,c-diamide adenosyltransferase [Ruminococcus sp.]
MLTLYYGEGKGKTCCAIGTALRASSKEKKVLFVEFIRQNELSDRKALESVYITVSSAPIDLELISDSAQENKAQVAKVFRELFDTAVITVLTRKFDMLVLDGVFDAVEKGFLLETEVHDFLSNAPNSLDVICTGVNVDEKFVPLFSSITELVDKTKEE